MTRGTNATRATTAGGATYVGMTALLAALNALADPDMRTGLPGWVEIFVVPILPTLITLVAGYASRDPRTHAP